MLNRRFLRIKALQALYSFAQEEHPDAAAYRRRLLSGLEKTYELYLYLMAFSIEFKTFITDELLLEKGKYIPSDKQVQTLQLIINNKAIAIIDENIALQNELTKHKVSWVGHQDLMRKVWMELKVHPLFTSYIETSPASLKSDKAFLANLMEWLIAEFELFESFVEDKYLNWDDDQILVLKTIQKTISGISESTKNILPDKHKDEEEDIKFLKDLFDLCVQHQSELMKLIADKTKNWDQDRIAVVDLILMKMALCEVLYFPFIPVKVSINEYLELAKLYSTPNSHGFINGILDKVQLDLKHSDRIKKLGRGLVN
ncbi:MAG: transcription antitermination factor NusB [Bacteroidota bacterium]|nr:transcription antitermination factor NusB [Bacteroidota bacterium]